MTTPPRSPGGLGGTAGSATPPPKSTEPLGRNSSTASGIRTVPKLDGGLQDDQDRERGDDSHQVRASAREHHDQHVGHQSECCARWHRHRAAGPCRPTRLAGQVANTYEQAMPMPPVAKLSTPLLRYITTRPSRGQRDQRSCPQTQEQERDVQRHRRSGVSPARGKCAPTGLRSRARVPRSCPSVRDARAHRPRRSPRRRRCRDRRIRSYPGNRERRR